MESRISDILKRMNKENDKLIDLRAEYAKCKVARKSNRIIVSSMLTPAQNKGTLEEMRLELSGDIVNAIMDLIETYYEKLGKQCCKNLDKMVEEMKQEK